MYYWGVMKDELIIYQQYCCFLISLKLSRLNTTHGTKLKFCPLLLQKMEYNINPTYFEQHSSYILNTHISNIYDFWCFIRCAIHLSRLDMLAVIFNSSYKRIFVFRRELNKTFPVGIMLLDATDVS